MVITAILGSPHGIKGNTSVLGSGLLCEAEQAGAQIVGISLRNCQIEPCLGCDRCIEGHCAMGDDFGLILKGLDEAAGIVLMSPMHFFNCSSYMKTFIDRCRDVLLRQAWKGKYGAVVMTSADTDCRNAAEYLQGFLRAAGCWTVGSVYARLSACRTLAEREHAYQASRWLGRRLVDAITQGEVFEDQQPVLEAYHDHLQCVGAAPVRGADIDAHSWTRWEGGGRA